MKKNLLTIAMVAGIVLPVSAQWYQTGGTVKVEPNTLKYVSGNHKLSGTSKEINEGNVRVEGNFTVNGDNAEFRNKFNSPTQYGQLIIKDTSNATGKVVSEYGTPGKNKFPYLKIAIPFVDVTAEEIATQGGVSNKAWQNHQGDGTFSPDRYKNPVFMWVNNKYSLDDLKANDVISNDTEFKPYNYYALNNYHSNLNDRLSEFKGTPANMSHDLNFKLIQIQGDNSSATNIFGEMLGSYIVDHFGSVSNRWTTHEGVERPEGYGDNLFTFGNPYTSNIDISGLKSKNITGVAQEMNSVFDNNMNQGNSSHATTNVKKAVKSNGGFTGDEEVFNVRPFHTFFVKTDGSNFNITLNDSNKKFDVSDNTPKYDGNFKKLSNGVRQLRVNLFNTNDYKVAHTYIVASEEYEASAQAGNQAYSHEVGNNVDYLYSLEESEDGSVEQSLMDNKVYINGINSVKYVGLPVYLVHQVVTPGSYTFKFNLSDFLISNTSNKFYFEDKETGEYSVISEDFEYTFTANETSKDRFAIYWNEKASNLGVNDLEVNTSSIVYKDVVDYKVHFASNLRSADIYVYNILGQLVHSNKNVITLSDYLLPLGDEKSVYVVKIVGNDGSVTTSKIIK